MEEGVQVLGRAHVSLNEDEGRGGGGVLGTGALTDLPRAGSHRGPGNQVPGN